MRKYLSKRSLIKHTCSWRVSLLYYKKISYEAFEIYVTKEARFFFVLSQILKRPLKTFHQNFGKCPTYFLLIFIPSTTQKTLKQFQCNLLCKVTRHSFVQNIMTIRNMFKVNNKTTRTMSLLTLNRFHTWLWCFHCWLWTSECQLRRSSLWWLCKTNDWFLIEMQHWNELKNYVSVKTFWTST